MTPPTLPWRREAATWQPSVLEGRGPKGVCHATSQAALSILSAAPLDGRRNTVPTPMARAGLEMAERITNDAAAMPRDEPVESQGSMAARGSVPLATVANAEWTSTAPMGSAVGRTVAKDPVRVMVTKRSAQRRLAEQVSSGATRRMGRHTGRRGRDRGSSLVMNMELVVTVLTCGVVEQIADEANVEDAVGLKGLTIEVDHRMQEGRLALIPNSAAEMEDPLICRSGDAVTDHVEMMILLCIENVIGRKGYMY